MGIISLPHEILTFFLKKYILTFQVEKLKNREGVGEGEYF